MEKIEIEVEELNRKRSWSACAGSLNGVRVCICLIEREASEAFLSGRDSDAKLLRTMSKKMKGIEAGKSAMLDKFISGEYPR